MLEMGIIKFEINMLELKQTLAAFRERRLKAFDAIAAEIREATSHTINQLMSAEMAVFLGSPDQSDNKRNGYETRQYALKGVGAIQVRVPIDRKRRFESSIIPKSERIDPRIKEDLAVLHLAGLSKRDIEMISKRLLGVELSRETASGSLALVEEKALAWLTRPLTKKYWALYIDGTNFKIQRRGTTAREPSLVVLGVDEQNRRSILAIEPGFKDNADSWKGVFSELMKRGLDPKAVQVGIMDGLTGLEGAFQESFGNAVTARCWIHAMKNALTKTPARYRAAFKKMLHKVMYAPSEAKAREAFRELKDTMNGEAGRAVKCIEKDLDSLVVHYRFEKRFWMALKTTNPIERVNKEFKKRSKSMGSMGEKTLDCLLAFTALRLELGWKKDGIDSQNLAHLLKMREKANHIEEVVTTLLQ